jgi:UDP-glucose 4-epimerase
MKVFITGVAGFIGSNMCDKLLSLGNHVIGYDNFSTGQIEVLQEAIKNPHFRLIEGDLLNLQLLKDSMQECDIVFHFSANADIKDGLKHPNRDLEQNTIATFHVLESMRHNGIKKIVFSSTGSVYGESKIIPTPEDAPFPIQTSLYAASKVAGETLIQAYCEGYNFQSWIFRFVSILGERYTHGHVFDFYKSLLFEPTTLKVLGNGQQKKSYLHVSDCIDGILVALQKADDKVNIFNLGADEYCQVIDSINWITNYLKVNPKLEFTGGERGWIGDNPFIFLDTSRIRRLGWKEKFSIRDGVLSTVKYLESNKWLFQKR